MNPQTALLVFQQEYTRELNKLTINSRPIIHRLTLIANENEKYANVIVSLVCNMIVHHYDMDKIRYFYVMDSILKNVRRSYSHLFGERVTSLFIEAYRSSSVDTRQRLAKLLKTWKDARVFDVNVLNMLEWEINGGHQNNQMVPRGAASVVPSTTNEQITADLSSVWHSLVAEVKQKRPDLIPLIDSLGNESSFNVQLAVEKLRNALATKQPTAAEQPPNMVISDELLAQVAMRVDDAPDEPTIENMFDAEVLTREPWVIVGEIYNLKHVQCKVCGLRMEGGPQNRTKHLLAHFGTRLKTELKHTSSNSWYVDAQVWQ